MTAKEGVQYLLMKCQQDEPVFILKASDKVAHSTVLFWSVSAGCLGVSEVKVGGAIDTAKSMREWAKTNPSRLPD